MSTSLQCTFAVLAITMLSVSLVSCSSTTDASKATTGDILFDPMRFEEEGAKKRAGLERLSEKNRKLRDDHARLVKDLATSESELIKARSTCESLDSEIANLQQSLARLEADELLSETQIEDKRTILTALKERMKSRASVEQEIKDINIAIDILQSDLDKRVELERRKFNE